MPTKKKPKPPADPLQTRRDAEAPSLPVKEGDSE